MDYYIGQRLSLRGQLCTICYVGSVADKPGTWLGVEWDDAARGKHNGTHAGKQYFQCRSSSSTAASFLKPNQAWDEPRSFLQALRDKYMPEVAGTEGEIVYFSSKKAEEVGFEKFAKRQAQLQGIHVVVLDHMRVRCKQVLNDAKEIESLCGHITELDLGSNLIESLDEILQLAALLPKLSVLTLDGNRFSTKTQEASLATLVNLNIKTLSLASMLLQWTNIAQIAWKFPKLAILSATHNELSCISDEKLPGTLKQLVLSENKFTALSDLGHLGDVSTSLEVLVLKRCEISSMWNDAVTPDQDLRLPAALSTIDLSYNLIDSWTFFNSLETAYPSLRDLHVTGNPLYRDLKSADGKPLSSADGYMLTIARLPRICTLNYSSITEKERLNAETYYLGQIALELSFQSDEKERVTLAKHPRWQALCSEYGEPIISRSVKAQDIDPSSLAARLINLTISLPTNVLPGNGVRTWNEEVPKSLNVYALLGLVGKTLGVLPLKLRLVWETGERDPRGRNAGHEGIEWWDSSEDESEPVAKPSEGFVTREVELVPGTRAIATYIEGNKARIRVEMANE